ncbi:MAG: hypothetical protein DSY37_03265 [Hyperthermus sp.]|nr:MAG: hypothetical protein DSY37_03265 [Hyperthermus sp.]
MDASSAREIAEAWLSAAANKRRIVLLLGSRLPELYAGKGSYMNCSDALRARRVALSSVWVTELREMLARMQRSGLLAKIIALSRDCILDQLPGDGLVVNPYGCCSGGREEHAPGPREPGDPAWQRLVGEAVYEATTADLLIACCIGGLAFEKVLAALARIYADNTLQFNPQSMADLLSLIRHVSPQ